MHSENFNKVKNYYDRGLWGESRVLNAVKKSWISAKEFEEITGKKYTT